jgi:ankyrin repeat protein
MGGTGDREGDLDCANEVQESNTYLNLACGVGRRAVVETLIRAGANVNSVCCLDDTPLNAAISNGSLDIVQLLLEHGASPTLGAPLEHAVERRSVGAVCLLLKRGAPVNQWDWAAAKDDPPMLKILAEGGRGGACAVRTSTSSRYEAPPNPPLQLTVSWGYAPGDRS